MGLDFTDIPDQEGAALYILHHGSYTEEQRFTQLKNDVEQHMGGTHQVLLIDLKTADGEKIRDFYDLMPEQLPAAIIIRDDDSISQIWSGDYIPSASDISYHLRQVSD